MQPSCSNLLVISRRNVRMTSNHHAPNVLSDTRAIMVFFRIIIKNVMD